MIDLIENRFNFVAVLEDGILIQDVIGNFYIRDVADGKTRIY
jgi:hypothetical protein